MTKSTAADPSIDALIDRIDVVEARLAGLSRMPYPAGQTEPDPGGEETWDAARVWAHIAELVGYWSGQIQKILAAPAGTVPDYGRLITDQGRADAIETDRLLPRETLWKRTHDGLEAARASLVSLGADQLDREGNHPVRGPVMVRTIFQNSVVKHVEEHADQLDKLAAEAREGTPAAG